MHVEDENPAGLQAGEPELTPIISKSAVMRFVASTHRVGVDDLAVIRGAGLYVYRDELVRAIAESLDAECPGVKEFLLPLNTRQVGRGTSFIGPRDHEAVP